MRIGAASTPATPTTPFWPGIICKPERAARPTAGSVNAALERFFLNLKMERVWLPCNPERLRFRIGRAFIPRCHWDRPFGCNVELGHRCNLEKLEPRSLD